MNKYIIIFIASLVVLYIYSYFLFPTSLTILQTTLNDFDFNLLLQKQPLVIGDKVSNIDNIINLWFSPNIVEINDNNNNNNNNNNKWIINNYKYLLIYCINDTEILLYQAGQKIINDNPDVNEPIIAIKLKKYQFLIIPFKWHYYYKNNNYIKIIGIHDYVTMFVSYII